MTDAETDSVIAALERLNRERISIADSELVSQARRLKRLQTEIRQRKLGALFHHIFIRGFRKKIHTKCAGRNLDRDQETAIARHGSPQTRVAVYTCIAGGYDHPGKPFYTFDSCDYLMYTDRMDVQGWERRRIPQHLLKWKDPAMINRYMKFHPFEFLAQEYDYAVYLDGNITPVSDLSVLAECVDSRAGLAFHRHSSRSSLKEELTACKNLKKGNPGCLQKQAEAYKLQGMPDDYGLVEGNVIVTDLKSRTARQLMDACWRELVKRNGKRDQIVWPYILWRAGIPVSQVCTLGNNVWQNVKLYTSDHLHQ